jgi:hypothetical protein
MELRKIYGNWDTGIGKYWHRIETTGGKSLKRPRFTTDCRATKEEEVSNKYGRFALAKTLCYKSHQIPVFET